LLAAGSAFSLRGAILHGGSRTRPEGQKIKQRNIKTQIMLRILQEFCSDSEEHKPKRFLKAAITWILASGRPILVASRSRANTSG